MPKATPTAVEELYDPESHEDKAKRYAKWYRGLAVERGDLETMQLANLAQDTDLVPAAQAPGFYADPKGEADINGTKARSYRQQRAHLAEGMKAVRAKAEELVGWKHVEEKLGELKQNPQAF